MRKIFYYSRIPSAKVDRRGDFGNMTEKSNKIHKIQQKFNAIFTKRLLTNYCGITIIVNEI
jgi:hypothetical protein